MVAINIGVLALVFCSLIGLAALKLGAARKKKQPSETVSLVKKRRKGMAILLRLVKDEFEANRLLQEEARRLSVPRTSLEALEAAIGAARELKKAAG